MANVNNDVTVTLSQEDKDLLIAAIKKCKEIADDCNYNSDMWLGADTVFAEIYDEYRNNELPTVIHLYAINAIKRGKALEQESSRNMKEIEEVINCDAAAEIKCKMISNILTAKPHYFEEPFINKPCVSEKVCEHDKQKMLEKIRAEIDKALSDGMIHKKTVLGIIDKYKAESEE